MDAGKIWVQLGVDDKQLQSGIKKTEASLMAMGNKMKSMGGMMSLALTAPLTLMAGKMMKLYDTQIQAETQLETVIKSTKGAAGKTAEELKAMASALQEKTTFGDEETIRMQALLLTFTGVKGAIYDQAIPAIMDMSTALGQDLQSSVIMVGKALNDPMQGINAMRRVGVSFTEEQIETVKRLVAEGKKEEAQLLMLTELQTEFGGTSEAAALKGLGPLKQMKNALGDLMEQFGAIIVQYITPYVKKVQELVISFQAMSAEKKKLIVVLGGVAAALGPVLFGVGSLLTKLPALGNALGTLVRIARTVSTALMANPYLAAAAAIIFLITVLYTYGKTQEDLKKDWEALKKAWTDTRAFEQIMGVYKEIFGGIWKAVTDVISVFQDLLSVLGITVNEASAFEVILRAWLVGMKLSSAPLRMIIKLISTLTGAVKFVVDVFKDWKKLSIEDIFNKIGDGIRDFVQNNPLTDLGRSIKEVFTGATEDSGSFQDAMKFDFKEMKRTAKEATITIEDMAQSFADSFEGMSDAQRASIKAVRLEYLKSVEEWIDGTVAKMKAEGFLNQSLTAQIQALDQFAKDAKSKMDIAMAEITGAGGVIPPIIPPVDPKDTGAETPEEIHKKALEQIQQEYKRAIALSSTYQQKLEAELKSIEDQAEAFRQLASIGGYDETEIAIMQAYQLSIDEVTAKLQELEKQKEDMAANAAFEESLEAEIQSIREGLLTEEEMIKKSWWDRVRVIQQAMAEGILTIQEGNALIQQITAETTKTLQENTEGIKTWGESWKEAGTQMQDALEAMVEDMVTSSVDMLASGKGMASVGLMIMSAFADMAIQVGKIAVGTAIAVGGIKEALKSLNPFVAAGAGLALIALGGFVKSQLANVGDMQGLATGGIVTSGGVFKVGEEGEELVTLPRGSAVTPNHMLQGTQGGYIASTRIAGRDLEILLERSAAQTKRR